MSRLSYFKYANSEMSPSLIVAINETIQENRAYATVIWKSRADDAIDATLHNALKYYSPEKGELRNYIISTMKNVLKNSFKKEHSMEDETLNFLVDASQEDQSNSELDDLLVDFNSEVSECVVDFLPFVVEDYEFFRELKRNKMKLDYSEILSKYSSKTIVSSLQAITTIYLPKVSEFMSLVSPTVNYGGIGTIPETHQKYEAPIRLRGMVQKIALVEGFSTKDLIGVDLAQLSQELIDSVYKDNKNLVLDFEGRRYYRTPSWDIVSSREELLVTLKEYCLNYLCKRLGFLVAEVGDDIAYLLGNNEKVSVSLFGVECNVSYDIVTRKEVVC